MKRLITLITVLFAIGPMSALAGPVFVSNTPGDNSGDGSYELFLKQGTFKIVIGVADVGDNIVESILHTSEVAPGIFGPLHLTTENDWNDMSGYYNYFGMPGTTGQLVETIFYAVKDNKYTTMAFDYTYTTYDYDPFLDFAFVDVQKAVCLLKIDKKCVEKGWKDFNYKVVGQTVSPVPLPGTLALLGLGLAGLGLTTRRRKV